MRKSQEVVQTMFRKTTTEGRAFPPDQIFAVGMILSMLAGYLEAYTYLLRGGVFCNGQTANIALMVLAFVGGNTAGALSYTVPIAAFFAGVVLAGYLRNRISGPRRFRWDSALLLFEAAVLLVVGLIPASAPIWLANLLVTLVCAVQYATFRETRGLPYASIFCTGNLRSAADYFYIFLRKRDVLAGRACLRYLVVVASFAAGVAIGALGARLLGVRSAWVCSAALLLLIPIMIRTEHG
jgi:uncharacterized membrane protein YoaK (UPF0700 family)